MSETRIEFAVRVMACGHGVGARRGDEVPDTRPSPAPGSVLIGRRVFVLLRTVAQHGTESPAPRAAARLNEYVSKDGIDHSEI